MAKVRGDKLYVTVPNLFRCPISMDVMRSPVSLCTGVTYDRTSIQRWLDSGHDTCPATMQVLPSKDFIPNLTLHRLIRLWLLSADPPSPDHRPSADHLRALLPAFDHDLAGTLSKIAEFAKSSADNRRLLAAFSGFDSAVVRALAGSSSKISPSENAVFLLDSVLRENGNPDRIRRLILDAREQCFDSMTSVLRNGSLKSKIETVRVLEFLACDSQSKKSISETRGLLPLVASLLKDGQEELNDAVLSFLGVVSVSHSAKVELVDCGVVAAVSELLRACSTAAATAERCLRVLAVVATCAEGRAAMAADAWCASAVVERVAKAKKEAAEDAVAVLWSLCCLGGSVKVRDDVAKRNGVAVMLLVMQSGWEEHVRNMCVDLIKVLKGACKNGLGLELGCYDTKTTHIKPC
ncbi:hypothetical protein Fmac_016078 [Flemingia macrophylla]|uniref:U-box domain-containing protein n=1 Tax=Flemingia macrophylla TaxID=520843 RepID=A0ABD1MII5_9FABA